MGCHQHWERPLRGDDTNAKTSASTFPSTSVEPGENDLVPSRGEDKYKVSKKN